MPEALSTFVILHHTLPDGSSHWDLCLDQGENLATWQLLEDPAGFASDRIVEIPARRIADHRREYLDYQGPISGGRGHVTRIDRGSFRTSVRRPDLWRIQIEGCILIGNYEIVSGDDSGQRCVLRRAAPN